MAGPAERSEHNRPMAMWHTELEWLTEETVFYVDGLGFSWGDVLLATDLSGASASSAALTQRALACERALARAGEPVGPEDLRAAATSFRYARNLLSAEELEGWLARWHLELHEWTGHLRRELSAARFGADKMDISENDEPTSPAAIAVDAICSGMLEREAARLAVDAALSTGDSATTGVDRFQAIAQLIEAAGEARRGLAAAADVEREIGARALDWTRIELELLEVDDADTAREVVLCVRVDGRPLIEVADEIGVPIERRELYVEQAEHEGLPELLGAGPGDLVGPVLHNDLFLVAHVLMRTRPSAADPVLRQRAVDYVVEHAVQRAFETRVRWV